MAPPTLPRSNFHQSLASGPSIPPPSSLSASTPQKEDAELAWQTSAFSYPDHVIPPRNYTGIQDLVIVCCHAIFHPDVSSPSFPLYGPHVESNWHLAPFQKSQPETGKLGEHETFLLHISAGIDALVTGPYADTSLLVFSGGVTKRSLTPLSEARSYYHAALALALSQRSYNGGCSRQLYDKGRILLEEDATDSFQNLLFSILLFRRTTGVYPKRILVITHAFKSKRVLNLHANALRWPQERIRVHGIDPIMSAAEREETVEGEARFGYAPWLDDALGTGEMLAKKRELRGWDQGKIEELGRGLEDSVQKLLTGKLVNDLPWNEVETDVPVDSPLSVVA